MAATARTGRGHPLKQRALDLAAGLMQRKFPVEAMSTYLNGFHFYADDRGRQVKATYLCIHHYEVKSGSLVAPGIPELAERSYFRRPRHHLRQDLPHLAI